MRESVCSVNACVRNRSTSWYSPVFSDGCHLQEEAYRESVVADKRRREEKKKAEKEEQERLQRELDEEVH